MTRPQLPPQAYTRETFARAYEWLRTQPEAIQKLASNPDNLVSLYLQARRHRRDQSLVAPVSSKKFSNELKSLAEGFRQFEGDPRSTYTSHSATTSENLQTPPKAPFIEPSAPENHRAEPKVEAPSTAKAPLIPTPVETHSDEIELDELGENEGDNELHLQSTTTIEKRQTDVTLKSKNRLGVYSLDESSRKKLQQIQQRFNLGSETEALRMVIVLGHERIFEIFPEP